MKGLSKGRYDETFAGEDDNVFVGPLERYQCNWIYLLQVYIIITSTELFIILLYYLPVM